MAKQKTEAVKPKDAAKPKKRGPKPKEVKATPKPRPKSENSVGRPKVPEEKRKIILDCLRKGNTKKDSCLAAGITPSTFSEWIVKATDYREQGIENEYTEFSAQVDEAMAQARRFVQECWQKHIPNDWRAGMAYLERTDPENWVVKQKMDVTSNGQSVGAMIIPMKDDGDE
jgi:transposase-like protein